MIRGRPTNLWLGLVTAIAGAIGTTAIVLGADPAVVATLSTSYMGVAGAAIALVATQPPTLAVGDTYNIATPAGQPNFEATVAKPPAPTQPVPVVEDEDDPLPGVPN